MCLHNVYSDIFTLNSMSPVYLLLLQFQKRVNDDLIIGIPYHFTQKDFPVHSGGLGVCDMMECFMQEILDK